MPSSRVYVGRLPNNARERDVERFFKGYGSIREVILKNGYGFVEFDDLRDAEDAVDDLNGKDLMGERLIIEHAKRSTGRGEDRYASRPPPRRVERFPPPHRTDYRLIVENLSSTVSWQDLKDFMRKAGEVTFTDAHRLKKNEGVVEFATHGDMKNALIKLNGLDLNGRKIRLVDDSKSRGSRKRSASRSRSRSKSRSKSARRSRSPRRSRTPRRSRSPRSKSKSKSRSRSPRRRSASHSPRRDSSRSPRRENNSRSPKRDNDKDEKRNGSPAARNDRSPSPAPATSNAAKDDASPPPARKSRSPSHSRSRSRSRS